MCVFYVLKKFQVVSTITVRDIYIAVVSVTVYYKKCECDHGVDKSCNLTATPLTRPNCFMTLGDRSNGVLL